MADTNLGARGTSLGQFGQCLDALRSAIVGGRVGVIELTSKRANNKLAAGIDALRREQRVGTLSAGRWTPKR